MNALAFLHSAPVVALLERAAAGAGVPLSVHYVERNQEGTQIRGWGQCAACRHVHELPGGAMACRLSRTAASTMALRQQRPIPFVCHLGFACVTAPLLPDEGYVLTLGPYCPMEEQRSLEDDLRAGFAALIGEEPAELPAPLDDIHRAPAASVPAIAEWTVEAVRTAWAHAQAGEPAPEPETDPSGETTAGASSRPGTQRARAPRDTGMAREIAAALAAGSRKQARALFVGALEEARRTAGRNTDVLRAQAVSLAAAALAALARTGVPASTAWKDYPLFLTALSKAETDAQMADAALEAFRFLRGGAARGQVDTKLPNYPELFALVKERLPEGITLEEVAAELGETPSAISHRLKRKFGMSFSDYLGRLRVDQAKQLLRRTGLGAPAVARRVGIRDPSNFARLFKKVEGMSPTAYRERYGKKK